MTEYYNISPWYNSQNWLEAYDLLSSPNSTIADKKQVLNLLLIWKARCPSLPSGIESTLSLLEVHLDDIESPERINQDVVLRLAYSSAIMRFVNHMLDAQSAKGLSLFQAAKNLNVPDWIIDLRHNTAHSHNLPSLDLLREAATVSLEWLCTNYWDKHRTIIRDYIVGDEPATDCDNELIAALMNLLVTLSICGHSQCSIDCLADIPDKTMLESVCCDIKMILGNEINLDELQNVYILHIIDILQSQSAQILSGDNVAAQVNRALLGADSLFLSLELVYTLSANEFNSNTLSEEYIRCYELLLNFLHANDLLLDFILELISVTQKAENDEIKKLAALWIGEILKALKKSNLFISKFKSVNKNNQVTKNNEDCQQLFSHWFPKLSSAILALDLRKKAPPQLTDINFIKPIISDYNPYLSYFIKDLLSLLAPALPKTTTDSICSLAAMISSHDKFSSSIAQVYTLDDVKAFSGITLNENSEQECVEMDRAEEMHCSQAVGQCLSQGIWQMASNEHDWSKYPLGALVPQHLVND